MVQASWLIFLNRVRRQWIVRRFAEHTVVGLLCGCVCACLFIALLLWRGIDGRSIAIVFPLLGLFTGAIAGARRRPTLLMAAALADEQLAAADLFGTALSMRDAIEPWSATIRVIADVRCAGVLPVAMIPHRLSPRTWAGVVMALGGLVTLALLSKTATPTQAHLTPPPEQLADAWAEPLRVITRVPLASPEAKAEQTVDSHEMPGDQHSDGSANIASANEDRKRSQSDSAGNGAGPGSARTNNLPSPRPDLHASSIRSDLSNGTLTAGGPGVAIRQAVQAGRSQSGEVTAAMAGLPSVAPWYSSEWPADREAAVQAIRAGRVPDAYREVVGDYFDRK